MAYFLCYVSTATTLFSDGDLQELLGRCQTKNRRLGVTGALLYRDGNFMQVLEGDPESVRALYTTIERDPRHHDVTHIVDGTTVDRQFDRWSMAFRDLTDDTTHLGTGYSDFFNPNPTHGYGDQPTMSQRLLLRFRGTLSPI